MQQTISIVIGVIRRPYLDLFYWFKSHHHHHTNALKLQ